MDKMISKPDEDEDFYAILGCDELSSSDQILAEYKVKVLSCHPDKHPDDKDANEKFVRLLHAKDVLLRDREQYDKWRNSGLSMTYKQWSAQKETINASFHWAYKKKEPTLPPSSDWAPPPSSGSHNIPRQANWRSDDVSDALRKFRNYEI